MADNVATLPISPKIKSSHNGKCYVFMRRILHVMKRWIMIIIFLTVAGLGILSAQNNPTPVPTSTSTVIPSVAEATPQPDGSVTPIVINPLLDMPIEPPISIELPDDWGYAYNAFLYTDLDGRVETIPFAYYEGPVTNATGTIILLWGFDTVVNPFGGQQGSTPWLDGLRLLRLVIMDNQCNIGTAPEREYNVGNITATGTQFSAVDCPEGIPDTRGWFAATFVDGVNFAFYVYADPIQPVGSPAIPELQAILDTVEFRVSDLRETQAELAATRAAFLTEIPLTLTPQATATTGTGN
jgi:hypothetical protein